MVPGTSGLDGLLALPLALMERCREPVSVTAPRTEAQSAEESGWKPPTASSETAQVQCSSIFLCLNVSEQVFICKILKSVITL